MLFDYCILSVVGVKLLLLATHVGHTHHLGVVGGVCHADVGTVLHIVVALFLCKGCRAHGEQHYKG